MEPRLKYSTDRRRPRSDEKFAATWASQLREACNERVMSSYAKYCRDQAVECARRARLASSPEVAANCLKLELRWIKLAEKADLGFGRAAPSQMAPRAVAARS